MICWQNVWLKNKSHSDNCISIICHNYTNYYLISDQNFPNGKWGGGSKFQTNSTIFCRSEYCTCTRMYPINDNCHVLWFGLHRNLRNKWTHFSPWLYTTVSYFAYKLNIEMIQDFLRILLLTFILDNICKLDNIQQLYIKRGKKDLYWQILVSHDQCGENALHLFLWSL